MDSIVAPIWALLTFVIGFLAWQVARACFPGDRTSDTAMHTVVLTWSWLVVASFVLSAVESLNALTLGGSVLFIALLTYGVSRRLCRVSGATHPGCEPAPLKLGLRLTWSLVASVAVCHLVRNGLCSFPTEWDTLMYHRPLISLWVQTGSLYVPQCAVWHFPGNNELLGLWWAIPFSGDFFVPLMNAYASFLIALATFKLAELAELTPEFCTAVALGTVAGAIFVLQSVDAKNDVATAALFTTSMTYGVRYIRGKNLWDLVFCGLSVGLLAGTKYYAVGYALIACTGLFVISTSANGYRNAVKAALVIAPILLVTSCYWYLRNWTQTGTPVFPVGYAGEFQTEVAGRLQRSLWSTSLIGNKNPDLFFQYMAAVGELGGFRQRGVVLALPLTLCWLVGSTMFADSSVTAQGASFRRGLLVMLLGAWIYFLVTPCTVDAFDERWIHSPLLVVRFSQIPLVLSLLAAALFLSDMMRLIKSHLKPESAIHSAVRIFPLLLIGEALVAYLMRMSEAMEGQALVGLFCAIDIMVVVAVAGRWLASASPRARRRAVAALLALGMLVSVYGTAQHGSWWHNNFAKHYDSMFETAAYKALDEDIESRTVMVLQYRYYPFFGSRRQSRVYRPLRFMSREFLFAYLSITNSDIVVVVTRGNRFERRTGDMLDTWIKEHPGVFLFRHTGSHFNTYKVNHEKLAEHLKDNPWLRKIPENSIYSAYQLN